MARLVVVQHSRFVACVVSQEDARLCAVCQIAEGRDAVHRIALRIGLGNYLAGHIANVCNSLDGGCAVNGHTRCLQGLSAVRTRWCRAVRRVVSHRVVYGCQHDVLAGFFLRCIGEERKVVRQRGYRDGGNLSDYHVVQESALACEGQLQGSIGVGHFDEHRIFLPFFVHQFRNVVVARQLEARVGCNGQFVLIAVAPACCVESQQGVAGAIQRNLWRRQYTVSAACSEFDTLVGTTTFIGRRPTFAVVLNGA